MDEVRFPKIIDRKMEGFCGRHNIPIPPRDSELYHIFSDTMHNPKLGSFNKQLGMVIAWKYFNEKGGRKEKEVKECTS